MIILSIRRLPFRSLRTCVGHTSSVPRGEPRGARPRLLGRRDLLEYPVHRLAVGGHEVARAGLHEVDAGPAKDAVEGPRARVADLVVAGAAEEEEVTPRPA